MPNEEQQNPFLGLSAEECREQLNAYLLTRNQLRSKIAKGIEALETWKKRRDLATRNGRQDLLETANSAFKTEFENLVVLKKELESLELEIETVRGQIETAFIKARGQISGTNPEALLASLEKMAGKSADAVKLDRQLGEAEADNLLAEFKASLGSGGTADNLSNGADKDS